MLWFLVYCIWSGLFLFIGANGMSLHWFWNGMFALLASGTLTYSMHRIARARLVHARLQKAIKAGKKAECLRVMFEAAFGTIPDANDSGDAGGAGGFAYVPASILVFLCLGALMDSVTWRAVIALAVAIPIAVLLGTVVSRLVAQRLMFEKAKKVITDCDSSTWDEMDRVWAGRKKAQAEAEVAEAKSRAAEEKREKEKLELPTKWMEISQNAGDAKSLAWLAACHLLHAEKVNIHRTVKHVMGGAEVFSSMTWEASKAKALEFGRKALEHCKEECGRTFCVSLIARAEALQSPTTPVTKSEGMSSSVGLLTTHYEYLPEELAILAGGQNLQDLSRLVLTIASSEWLIGFGGISQVGGKQE